MMASKERRANKELQVIRKAVSGKAEIIAPFQYYTEAGEAIYSFFDPSTNTSQGSYLHVDAAGKTLALIDRSASKLTLSMAMEETKSDEEFETLMGEMHTAAIANPDQLYDRNDFENLRSISRGEPILIGGCGRSGTTLLLSILGAHPDIFAIPDEMYAFYPFPFRLSKLISAIQESESGNWTHWCEKTPKNVRAFPEIFEAFEGRVKLIHIVRDGRDVVSSHHPNADERYYVSPERWVADVAAGWKEREITLLIRYEDLVNQAQATLEVVCEYLGIPFDERMLEFEAHSNVQENKAWEGGKVSELSNQRVARWQAAEHSERVADFMATEGAERLMSLLDYA